MFLLVSVRHVGAHPGEHQHGVSIQISINLGKTFLRISRIRNIPLTWILARVFAYLPPFISQFLDFIYWTVSIFILIYFEWRDTENQHIWRETFAHHVCSCEMSWDFPWRLNNILSSTIFLWNTLSCHSVLWLAHELLRFQTFFPLRGWCWGKISSFSDLRWLFSS